MVNTITRSSMVDLERSDVCYRKWKAKWVDKTVRPELNKPMILGLYFEQLCIGASAYDDGKISEEQLPKGRGGKESVIVTRIKNHVERFKKYFDAKSDSYLGFEIIDVQSHITYNAEFKEVGICDIKAKDQHGNEVIIDLKLTQDADSTRHPKSFGHDEDNDFTQAQFYLDIEEKNKTDVNDFYYLIFDYSPSEKVKLIKYSKDEEGILSIRERKNVFIQTIKKLNSSGFEEIPSKDECKDCTLDCQFKDLFQEL